MSVVYKQEVVAGVPDFQTIYDLIHPINEVVIGFNAPAVPNGVTATWEDISSEYEGKALWVSSTDAAGTELSGSCPSITGTTNRYFIGDNHGASSGGSLSFVPSTYTVGEQSGTSRRWGNINFDASKSSAVYSSSAGKDIVRPTSVVVKVYKRTS